MTIAVLGIDLAKRVFQLHGVDARGRPARVQPRRGRAGQQDGADRLGADGAGRGLQSRVTSA